ncbi:MAG: sulfatase [Kiritimatiellae bacterium]|nr:sulfatase [Kiritimatiellia bacterium]
MGKPSDTRPNVVFIICDDLNSAIAGMGRRPCAPAPNLNRLMSAGVRFPNAHNNCPICLPSRNSMLAGLYPHTTGHYTLWDKWRTQRCIRTIAVRGGAHTEAALLDSAVMLPKHFHDNGYNTFGVGKIHHEGRTDPAWWTDYAYGPDYGPFLWDSVREKQRAHPDRLWLYEGEPLRAYARRYEGVDRFFLDGDQFRHHIEMLFGPLSEAFAGAGADARQGSRAPFRYVNDEERDPLPDEKATAWALDVLRRRHDKPFFLGVGYMKPHCPLNVPQRFFDLFPADSLELPPFLADDCADCARALVEHRPYGFLAYDMILKGGEPMWRKWLQAYLACVAFVDEQVGRLLDALRQSPWHDNTIVVFTSDNGYHMGEKSFIFKDTLWEEAGQVPLIVSANGVAQANGVCRKPVSLIDLYPTLIELCGLPNEPHNATHGHPLQGHSLRPFLEAPRDGVWAGPPVALTSVRGDTGIHHSVRSERHRYTLCQNGEEELYDHETDPHEWHNLAGNAEYANVRTELRARMMEMLET